MTETVKTCGSRWLPLPQRRWRLALFALLNAAQLSSWLLDRVVLISNHRVGKCRRDEQSSRPVAVVLQHLIWEQADADDRHRPARLRPRRMPEEGRSGVLLLGVQAELDPLAHSIAEAFRGELVDGCLVARAGSRQSTLRRSKAILVEVRPSGVPTTSGSWEKSGLPLTRTALSKET